MSEAIAFDTHRYVKSLTGCGFTETQAETLAEGQVALLNSNLATKADVEALRQETKVEFAKVGADVDALRQETKTEITSLKAELVRWMFGGMVAMTGIFAAIVGFMVPGG